MPQSLSNLYIHLIFSTKNRAPLLVKEQRSDLHAYLSTVLANLNSPTVLINSVEDHVHILFKMARTVSLAQIVEDVKKSSSKWLKTQSPSHASFAWHAGYGSFSVSESNVAKVTSYIRDQEQHHRKQTFQDEYLEFLEKNKIQWDERYVWD